MKTNLYSKIYTILSGSLLIFILTLFTMYNLFGTNPYGVFYNVGRSFDVTTSNWYSSEYFTRDYPIKVFQTKLTVENKSMVDKLTIDVRLVDENNQQIGDIVTIVPNEKAVLPFERNSTLTLEVRATDKNGEASISIR